ncbi:MAG: class I SAM-dependent methyltransferase [Candidatus Electrothrix gigas]
MHRKNEHHKTPGYLLAPGGKKYTLTAGMLADLGPGASVLEVGCGMGCTAVELAEYFDCTVEAFDLVQDFIDRAEQYTCMRKMTEQIRFHCADIFEYLDHIPDHTKRFDLAVAEGGALTAVKNRRKVLSLLYQAIKPGGYLYLSDLLVYPWVPEPVRQYYAHLNTMTEERYRTLLAELDFDIKFSCLLPEQAWHDYFTALNQALREKIGFLGNPKVAEKVRQEEDIYYKQGGHRSVDYLFVIAQKEVIPL